MSDCPSSNDLDALARGVIDAVDAGRMREHVAGCKNCSAVLTALNQSMDEDTKDMPISEARTVVGRPAASNETLASGPPPSGATAFEETLAGGPPQAGAPTIGVDIAADSTLIGGSGNTLDPSQHYPDIEGYRIVNVLGQGGMGIVYRAEQKKLNRTVALKVLPAIFGSANPQSVSRFRREAVAAARLHHTNIIPVYDFGESDGAYYYAMEMVIGRPLDDIIKRLQEDTGQTVNASQLNTMIRTVVSELPKPDVQDGLTPPVSTPDAADQLRTQSYFVKIARWIADAADALNYAHEEGIIHRDIKPANLILSHDGRIMIADFGLAKSTSDASVTQTGSLVGTLRYLSPEQAMAKRVPVDHRTDIYSLGATMYELLTLQPAFPGNDDKEILGAVISREPTRPRKIQTHIPPELETICVKMMEKSAADRYATARDAAEDLRRYLSDLPIFAKRPSLLQRAVKFVKRHKAPVAACATGVLLVATSIFLVVEQKQRLRAQIEQSVEAGLRWQIQKDYGQAASEFQKVLAREADNFRALYNLSVVKKDQFNAAAEPDPALLEEALRLCERAIAVRNHEHTWNLKGVLLKKLERYPEAAQAYAQAVALNPDSVASIDNLAIVQVLIGDLDEATTNLQRAIELSATPTGCNWRPWRLLATVQLFRNESTALETLDQAIECNRTDEWSRLLRARAYLELDAMRDPVRALVAVMAADEHANGRNPRIKRTLALAMLRNQRYQEAITAADAARELEDDSIMGDLVAAIASARLDEPTRARALLDAAVARWPADLTVQEAFRVTADAGILWFERAAPLHRLRTEAEGLLAVTE